MTAHGRPDEPEPGDVWIEPTSGGCWRVFVEKLDVEANMISVQVGSFYTIEMANAFASSMRDVVFQVEEMERQSCAEIGDDHARSDQTMEGRLAAKRVARLIRARSAGARR